MLGGFVVSLYFIPHSLWVKVNAEGDILLAARAHLGGSGKFEALVGEIEDRLG
jgi:hypothetical protein